MQAGIKDRLLSAIGAVFVVALLGYGIVRGMAVEVSVRGEQRMAVLDLPAPRPQRPAPLPHIDRPNRASRPASPRNLKSKAAEIVAPPQPMPLPSPVVSAPKAGLGMAASAGASDRPGPGAGAGGEGDGTGGGGQGDGEGGAPPRQIKGRLKFSDLPPGLRSSGFEGAVSVRYDVGVDGKVDGCTITASSGSTELDQLTCRLIERRFRFDPSRDPQGRPVRSTIEESHSWEIDPGRDPPIRR